ncbi:MAG TPA: efflux RND transporter periplasmic adaptor subunit, partial [Methylocella sp.]|nr:efflux RND transporter periplasmic adaptor subunit [Methylocella sp.]
YTTFSSFSLQTLSLAQDGEWLLAGANAGISVVLCLLAVWLGHILAALLNQLNLAAVFGLLLVPLGWGWALAISGCAIVWLLLTGRVKLLAYRIFGRERPAPQAAPRGIPKSSMNRRTMAGALVVLICAGGWLTWMLYNGGAGRPVAEYVERAFIGRTVSANGVITAANAVAAEPHVSGVIQARTCDVGMKVKAGELCAKIDPRPYLAAVSQEKAKLAEAEARLEKDNAALKHAQASLERHQIRAKRHAISMAALDKSRDAYERARARTISDEASITEHQTVLRAAGIDLANTDIVSPIDGTVVSRSAEIGQTVTAGSQTHLFLVAADLTRMHIEANVSGVDIDKVAQGDKATFTVGTLPNHTFNGEVTEVSQWPRTAGNMKTYGVIISAPNPDLLLQPGMTAAVTFAVDRRDGGPPKPIAGGHSS